ncbi:serine hydrolase domain-containing protein [Pseudogracilibacillus auburnensis]|uniref:CubicO group peptidase (Beta-lactamase class C family) n=1 Tax=Pseudogracilibacillus auburnensis TaxID=1494959 RepID=A0A2V3VXC9_9BACI|nr:serine hydrolase domain-containing protein [Pseudogracilibacillus auburnensis]PXW85594.1 CubicO group peptidase (beta-lactamase class C family) [Pseudogracilibacillus auburnensis]
MKKIFVLIIMATFLSFIKSSPVLAQVEDKEEVANFIDQVITEQLEQENIPNAVVSIVYKDEIIFQKGYGYANMESGTSIDPETSLFRIGSVSKLLTWTAVMQLVEQGELDLHTDINEYLDFKISDQVEGNQHNSKPNPITLHHLMTHTPGFEDYSNSIFRLSENGLLPLNEYVRYHMPKRIFPAGEMIAYSNYGTALAGYIVQQVSGMPFSEYIEHHILNKLGMENSTFEQPLPEQLKDQSVTPYRYVDGNFIEGSFEFLPEPAGAMSSSAADMATFMRMFLQEGSYGEQKILEKDTVRQMFEQQYTQHPNVSGMGLGFIEANFNDQRILFHGGGTLLFNSGLYLIPDEDIGMFISYSGGNHFLHKKVFQQFLDEYLPIKNSAKQVNSYGSMEKASQFAGEYHQNRKSVTTDEKFLSLTLGMIHVKAGEKGTLHVTHAGETNEFFEVAPGIYENPKKEITFDAYGDFKTIVFETDANGDTMLVADGPMTYSKAPWYATSAFTFSTLVLSVLFIFGSFLFWIIRAALHLVQRKKKHQTKTALIAKWAAIIYSVLFLGLIISVILTGEIDPVYQLPKDAFGKAPDWHPVLNIIPYVMSLFSIALLITTFILWKKKDSKRSSRIHCTLFSVVTLFLTWIFYYWNLL